MFADRREAGKQLAAKLARHKSADAVVLALPRGGVVVGYEVARALGLPLDIVAARKIGHPSSPEYAIGAVDESGEALFNDAEALKADARWLEEETEREQKEAKRRARVYRAGRAPLPLAGKTAILVDDGIATGLTMRLAARAVKKQGAKKIIVAAPVAPEDSLRALKDEGADETIVLEPPEDFLGAVGAHYAIFDQTKDDEVIRLLSSAQSTGDLNV